MPRRSWSRMTIPTCLFTTEDFLRIVRSHVHLGTLTTPSGSYAQEVSRRTQSMLHAYLPLAKSTFGEPSFPIKTRLVLAE